MSGFASIQQSGALPYQKKDGILWILLVKSRTSRRWIFPKGNIEPGLTAAESAYREAFEEAGVLGTISTRSIGTYTYRKKPEKGGKLCRVKLYPLEVTQVLESYPERSFRQRTWLLAEEALSVLDKPKLIAILQKFIKVNPLDGPH